MNHTDKIIGTSELTRGSQLEQKIHLGFESQKKFVLTGGPCVGKTTILTEIEKYGHITTVESARYVIEQEQEKEKTFDGYQGVFPWTDYDSYHKKITDFQLEIEQSHSHHSTLYMDRSLVDNIAYIQLRGMRPTNEYLSLCESAQYDTIFFLEQLPFYTKDSARTESREEMLEVHNKIFDVYSMMGYDVVRVPFMEKEDRARFILDIADERNYTR